SLSCVIATSRYFLTCILNSKRHIFISSERVNQKTQDRSKGEQMKTKAMAAILGVVLSAGVAIANQSANQPVSMRNVKLVDENVAENANGRENIDAEAMHHHREGDWGGGGGWGHGGGWGRGGWGRDERGGGWGRGGWGRDERWGGRR